MKLLRYGPAGREKPGLLDKDGNIRDLSGQLADIDGAAISPAGLARLAALDTESLPRVDGTPRLGPCVSGVSKVVCVGLNYADHAAETQAKIPGEPILFMKATTAITGPNDEIIMPRGSTHTDWEVELGVIIGRKAQYVSTQRALDYVAGYCIVNDVSERYYQKERWGQWTKGKSCDTFCPMGPWLVTHDEIPDPQALDLHLDINGRRRQTGNTRTMIFGVAHLVSYISEFMTLLPGDLIATGTPPGVGLGEKPPSYLKAGDVLDLSIEGLGHARQPVREWTADSAPE
ncbi:MAG: fumarylacetoacetate hydrolase family protein [Steroidobacteraceae bacterium]|jgi:2-keto-4-pentenoate hydratase/2-oxohepta-3-ene-1,7-dioic acid hydratase in catechol pathway